MCKIHIRADFPANMTKNFEVDIGIQLPYLLLINQDQAKEIRRVKKSFMRLPKGGALYRAGFKPCFANKAIFESLIRGRLKTM
jgi:hypothetical protein